MAVDPRFYRRLGPLKAADLAERIGAQIAGDGALEIGDLAEPGQAQAGSLAFLSAAPGAGFSLRDPGAAFIVTADAADAVAAAGARARLVHASPKAAFAKAALALFEPIAGSGERLIATGARIASDATIGPGAIIGEGADVGSGARVESGAVIGPGVSIGARTRIGARAVVQFALVGADCDISAGAVIGETGFGLTVEQGALISLPHMGRVVIEDGVTLGANSTVDRGMLADTRLRKGCRIDNMCHVGHNVDVGENAVMAAFAGISGSVKIGAGAQFGGRVGVADHLSIGAGARLAADAAVMRDVPDGETWAGSPAQPIQRFMRETAWLRRASGKRPGKTGQN